MCLPEYVYVLSEEEERAALDSAAAPVTDDPATWTADTRVRLAVPHYDPTPADLDAQAAADREQEQADRDYRELARLALASEAGACRCGIGGRAPCLSCRVARWLALGL
jgi:hypothetical protein